MRTLKQPLSSRSHDPRAAEPSHPEPYSDFAGIETLPPGERISRFARMLAIGAIRARQSSLLP